MKNFYLMLIACVLTGNSAIAQTWTGTTNTDWNTATNWNTGTVPLSTGAVIIPGSVVSNNWPVLASSVTLNSINMQSGSRLDVNGFSLSLSSVNTYNYFTGTTINNSNLSADIVFNINTGGAGYETYFRSSTVNDHITFNLTGTNAFHEGDAASKNTFNGNVTYNAGFSGNLWLSNSSGSQYSGNLSIYRTVAGFTQAFNSGADILGNLSFTNTVGGTINLGNVLSKTAIGGTVNIDVNSPDNIFRMSRLINQTTGGIINVQNTQAPNIQKDTLLVSSISLTGYRGSAYALIYNNSITGNVNIADHISYIGGYDTELRNNVINGTTTVTTNGPNAFYDADAPGTGNLYFGDVSISATSTGTLNISFADTSSFSGNLTIGRTAAGLTQIFNTGGVVSGNFSYTNNFGGNSFLGNMNIKTAITGTVNITAVNPATATFQMRRIINQTTGGAIDIQNTVGADVQRDTLLLNSISITGYRGSAYAYIYNNKITGNLSLADHSTYGGGYETLLRNNIIIGNTNITTNSSNSFFDADAGATGNQYNGNVTITALSTGAINFSLGDTSYVTGNLAINRTTVGLVNVFNSGGIVAGNFALTSNPAANVFLGNSAAKTEIGGTVNITANYASPAIFQMRRLVNQTTGGTVSIQNSFGFDVQRDTLILSALNINGYRGNAYAYFYDNSITGNLNISDDVSFSTGYATYIRNNTVTGNSIFTTNGANFFYDGDAASAGNKYIGNVSYIKNSGPISVGAASFTEVTQNLTLNSASGITLNKIRFNGTTNGTVEQLGTQALIIPELAMAKTGTGKLTLNDPVTVSLSAAFNGGNIQTSAANPLIFNDNVTHSGANTLSHVQGPVAKIGNDAFIFPTGGNSSYNTVAMAAPALTTDRFSAEYIPANPHPTFDTSQRAASLRRISACEYWDVKREAGTSNVVLTFSFENPCAAGMPNYITDPSALRVAHWNGALWEDHGNGGTTGTTTGTISTAGPVSDFSPFTFASVDVALNPLPLTLISFTAQKKGMTGLLEWKTENEIDFSRFEIEKSGTNNNFEKLADVAAKSRAGTNAYSVTDFTPAIGLNYYRLKLIDINGRFTYSPIAKLFFTKGQLITVAPNPTHDFISVREAAPGSDITVLDMQGRILITERTVSANHTINVMSLPAGIYMLRATASGKAETVTFIKN